MSDERAGDGAAGDGMHHRRFDFEKLARVEKDAKFADDLGALEEDFADAVVGDEVEIALAEAQLDVDEAMPFFGKREKRFGEQAERSDPDAQLAGARAEHAAFDAHEVAEIEQAVELEGAVAEDIELDVDLNALAGAEKMGEAGFAVAAKADDAAGDADGRLFGFEFVVGFGFVEVEELGGGVREFEAMGIGLFPELYDLLEIFLPLPVLVERFKRQAESP